jgi:N-acetylglucosaminyl-diphospho-decaprenol L-rhamnosyltransferase
MLPKITISIVSHGQCELIHPLMEQLKNLGKHVDSVILTHNTKKHRKLPDEGYPFKFIQLCNDNPKGFGTNHNKAFGFCRTQYFCVINPDISIAKDPFPSLLRLAGQQDVSILSPKIINKDGAIEDSARYFPTPWGLIKKVFGNGGGVYPIEPGQSVIFPDWVGGMFMLFKSDRFKELAGFDESFFLYYEDVDICIRTWKKGWSVGCCPEVEVIHDARRSSHKDLIYLKWHIRSVILYFIKHLWRYPRQ